MAKENKKTKAVFNEMYLKIQDREENYLHALEAEKRHELLFAPYGVSFFTYRTLSYLMFHPQGAAPSEIADALGILRQSMTNIVDMLEKRGLVERKAHPQDRRRIQVQLLPAGEELGKTLLQVEDNYRQRLYQYITEDEVDAYHRLEKKMYEAKVSALNDILEERKNI